MTKASITLQDLRRRIYAKAKAEPSWRFWGLYVHVCKRETLREAYRLARENDGAPGIDGVTFEDIESGGVEDFLAQIQKELISRSYRPMRVRRKEIPKGGGNVRVLSIPTIRDRVVQGAVKLILEPIFEADFQPGSYGYRPKRKAQQAVEKVAQAIVENKTRVFDLDLRAYFDKVRHHILLEKVAARVQDPDVMDLLKMILTSTGKKGVPQGGVMAPRTQKGTSNSDGVSAIRARANPVDKCHIWLYSYDSWRNLPNRNEPSGSTLRWSCFGNTAPWRRRQRPWRLGSPFPNARPIGTFAKPNPWGRRFRYRGPRSRLPSSSPKPWCSAFADTRRPPDDR